MPKKKLGLVSTTQLKHHESKMIILLILGQKNMGNKNPPLGDSSRSLHLHHVEAPFLSSKKIVKDTQRNQPRRTSENIS